MTNTYVQHGHAALKRALARLSDDPDWMEKLGPVGVALRLWRTEMIDALGGEDAISPQQRALIELAARTHLMVESVDRFILGMPSPVNKRTLVRSHGRRICVVRPAPRTPYTLTRHSFASILISKGRPIAYVQQALGHESISMTVDTYGSWLPVEAPGAVNVSAEGLLLDQAAPLGNQQVTKGHSTGNIAAKGSLAPLADSTTSSPRRPRPPRSPCTCI
jgi:hypothetical protein